MDYGFTDTAIIFITVELRDTLQCEYAPGGICRVRVAVQICSFCWLCMGAMRLICCAHCSEALPFHGGCNQPGNSFPSGFEAVSWDSSLLAVVQHRIACSSSLASNTALCSCSHWFPFLLVKFSCAFFRGAWTSRYAMKRSWCLDAKCVAVAGWGQFCYVQVPGCSEPAGWQGAGTLRWAQRSFVESWYSVFRQFVFLDGHGK